MKTDHIIALIGKTREKSNAFILWKLKELGIEGLAPSHGGILVNLFRSSPLSMKELAERVGRDKSTITALVNKLIKLGYVEKRKDPSDSRVTLIALTREGEELKPDFEYVSAKLMSTTFRGFSQEEKEQVVRLLERIHGNFS
ncbi:MarR family winged helix-turn-helix transcriptional regulator [Desulfoluna spongiiphila]|uniref:Transcriptional regulator, MarR family n=1 Tax=Desulfoluna spongiiphila TaxID=419481 RepID=A0A1G5EHD6_9BACT|nr:MarR family transcriptional regulator [Desulfoluna spongiiphila]SCY26423.1 transcriptional regulator, MarR family [Desulfoluna spongiiphila]